MRSRLCLLIAVVATSLLAQPPAPAPQGTPPAAPGPDAAGRGGGRGRGGRGGAPEVPAGPVRRLPNGKPDMQGYWNAGGGGLFSIEATEARRNIGVGAGRGIITDPADGKIPYQPWARAKEIDL